ncbi:hypothetical protein EYZ11_003852 [Aspergillus tanneri]|uniref:Uncharacterized protein n=1 Tax=Aspergillus tanneri TaxID=1220188 RepID=A0A4S3JPA0_9EURO|nr:uncharacterized protein ATNIH1004_005865 [Aspergillus tanneri]KAA8647175.1 hypothetical protein ATNIH1004_005865 [Aspergillus tanneri]THC96647.1 hypothetical protein EYZ11_003852 [Aspergillus tanneri]
MAAPLGAYDKISSPESDFHITNTQDEENGARIRDPVSGPEWLASEPEHAMVFAQPSVTAVLLSSQEMEPNRRDLERLIQMQEIGEGASFDWQAIADVVVERYARELRYLVSGQLATLADLHEEIENSLGPFVDYDSRDHAREVHLCATQVLPARTPDGVAARAIWSVTQQICSTTAEAWNKMDYGAAH